MSYDDLLDSIARANEQNSKDNQCQEEWIRSLYKAMRPALRSAERALELQGFQVKITPAGNIVEFRVSWETKEYERYFARLEIRAVPAKQYLIFDSALSGYSHIFLSGTGLTPEAIEAAIESFGYNLIRASNGCPPAGGDDLI